MSYSFLAWKLYCWRIENRVMITEIPLLPEIPENLRIASKEGNLVLFIGAGVSQIAGSPGWSDFADHALRMAKSEDFNFALLDQIRRRSLSPRIKLALALDFAKRSGIPIDFETILHPEGRSFNAAGQRLFGALNALGRNFVTTNYDYWLDDLIRPTTQYLIFEQQIGQGSSSLPRETFHRLEEIKISLLHRTNVSSVIHIHGSLNDSQNMVLTTSDYITRYGHERGGSGLRQNNIHLFLEDLFHTKTVLFVGYGLDELEILEYIIMKAKRDLRTSVDAARHFILQPFFSHEAEVAKGISSYFKSQCGVTLLPFLRDKRDFAQLIDVIEYFAQEIPVGPILNIERRNFMDDLLK